MKKETVYVAVQNGIVIGESDSFGNPDLEKRKQFLMDKINKNGCLDPAMSSKTVRVTIGGPKHGRNEILD